MMTFLPIFLLILLTMRVKDISGFQTSCSLTSTTFLSQRHRLQRQTSISWNPRISASSRHSALWQASKSTTESKAKFRRKGRDKRRQRKRNSTVASSGIQTWRVYNVEVHPDSLANATAITTEKNNTCPTFLNSAVLESLWSRLRLTTEDGTAAAILSFPASIQDVRVARRSLDARRNKRRSDGSTGPRYVYVMDVVVDPSQSSRQWKHQPGRQELLTQEDKSLFQQNVTLVYSTINATENTESKRVVIVGAGPAGLFCALQLARAGHKPIVLERGQAVESRGKDIGALMHRRSLDSESNFCFGEGGAGTWSDGKLTTRIGRNSGAVRWVLETLVEYGAPDTILIEGAPHLGTDRLVRILRNMRDDLRRMGGQIQFGTRMTGLLVENGAAVAVDVVRQPAMERNVDQSLMSPSVADLEVKERIHGDAVVLATGHSARDVYEQLHRCGVKLELKGFAVGYRVEHPQKLINKIQYGTEWGLAVNTGKRTTDSENRQYFEDAQHQGGSEEHVEHHNGKLPVPSYRLATDQAFDGSTNRGAYSFCMCPGGQIVPASTDPLEVCVNGMSFSRRDSVFANSALVVTVNPDDPILDPYREKYGVLAGIIFQREMEQRASQLGGGNLTVPVQRLTDFLKGRASMTAPPSSYRLGVKPAACHEIYPPPLIKSLRNALTEHFEKIMPGYICDEALLHAVETRTSSPVRVARDDESLQAIGIEGLFPAGEGAGFAGGIVSAAVDGMAVALAVIDHIIGDEQSSFGTDRRKSMKNVGSFY